VRFNRAVDVTCGEAAGHEQERGKEQELAHMAILTRDNQAGLNGRDTGGRPTIMVTWR
jgi:hypothetical protein